MTVQQDSDADEFLPPGLIAMQLVHPGDEVHYGGEWHEIFTIEEQELGLVFTTSEDRTFLAQRLHRRRTRKPRPRKPTISK